MITDFREKCKLFRERLDILNNLLINLKQQIILQDLSTELGTQIKLGRHLVSGIDWLEEIDVGGESFNLINTTEKNIFHMLFIQKNSIIL